MSRSARTINRWPHPVAVALLLLCVAAALLPPSLHAAERSAKKTPPFPPKLPGGKQVVTDTSRDFLKSPGTLKPGVVVAKAMPTIDFMYYPGQNYSGNPWSNWGDSVAAPGKYYASIGDHLAPQGDALVFEYDPAKKSLRQLLSVKKVLNLPEGHYMPGKIHSRLDLGEDGQLYFATHRGSTNVTSDKYHYTGDWILRCDPASGKTEVVARAPVPKHCIPCSLVDATRMIFYGGTAAGSDAREQGVQFFAYDLRAKKLLYSGPDGPPRYMALAQSTGRLYFTPATTGAGPLMRFDPGTGGPPKRLSASIGIRAASQETPQGKIYTVSQAQHGEDSILYAIDTKTEAVEVLGPASVATQTYITSLDADPTGKYLYYVPGAHGGSETDGTPVVQYDLGSRRKKVIAFLHPFYKDKYSAMLRGTFSSALAPEGDKLYVTWNVSRESKVWDSCALTVIHIPESERGKGGR